MILVDTSIWVDHLRSSSGRLVGFLNTGRVLMHPFVLGELALGHLKQRNVILADLKALPQARVATGEEVLHFIDRRALTGLGIGYVDVHLLAAVALTLGATLWTGDKRLHAVANRMGLAMV